MKITKKTILLFGIWFILISGCIFVGWESYKLKQDVDLVKSRIEQVSLNSQIMFKNIQSSNKRGTNIQEQIAKIQDFEDRRYNAITAQLNSFWSGVNGFIALVGIISAIVSILFAVLSLFLAKQVESATKNIDALEQLKKDIDDYIAKKSFELYERTIKQDIAQILNIVRESKDYGAIESAYDLLRLRINYVTVEELISLYNSFKHNLADVRQTKSSYYYKDLSYYLVLMLFKSPVCIPDCLIQELIDGLSSLRACDMVQSFILLNDLCNVNQAIGKILGERTRQVFELEKLCINMLDNKNNDASESDTIRHILTKWFGLEMDGDAK